MKTLTRLIKLFLATLLLCTGLPAQAMNWYQCAIEGKVCAIPNNQPVLVRYGHPDYAYFYYSMGGVSKFTCKTFNGNPILGSMLKTCSYALDASLGFTDSSIVLTPIADENSTVNGSTELKWVHYGLGNSSTNDNKGTWWNTVQAETWKCSNGALNFDPTPGQPPKKCYQGLSVPVQLSSDNKTPKWTTCAYENSDCVIPNSLKGAPIVLRYGFGSNWTNRIVTVTAGKIKCQTATFNEDPIHVNKICQYVPIMSKTSATVGNWTKIVDSDCSAMSGTLCNYPTVIRYGTNYDKSTTAANMTAWANTVKASIAKSGIIGVGNTVSVAASTAYANSLSSNYPIALNSDFSLEQQVSSCSAGQSAGRMVMYQFSTSTSAKCLKDGSCDKTTNTSDTYCVMNPPPAYEGPQCLPGYCSASDSLCLSNSCTYPAQ